MENIVARSPFTIYVGMALTEAPDEFRVYFQQELKARLRQLPNVEVFDFVGLENGTAVDVYEHDQKCTQTADLCVFIVDYPSLGLGMEIEIRNQTNKPALFFAGISRRVTRMLIGCLEKNSKPLHRYENVSGITEIVYAHILSKHPDYWP